jgi:threonine dehydratase
MAVAKLKLPTSQDVAAARINIQGRAVRTPLLKFNADVTGTNIYLKLENLQPLGSFKIRPAVNVLKSFGPALLRRGVLTSSAGNFGQGLAYAAREIGVAATVVVPDASALTKTAALAELGCEGRTCSVRHLVDGPDDPQLRGRGRFVRPPGRGVRRCRG